MLASAVGVDVERGVLVGRGVRLGIGVGSGVGPGTDVGVRVASGIDSETGAPVSGESTELILGSTGSPALSLCSSAEASMER